MKDLKEVVAELEAERQNQFTKWPPGQNLENYAKRSFEVWLILAFQYAQEALVEYTHKPGNAAAREKLLKAVNLGLWGLQSEQTTD